MAPPYTLDWVHNLEKAPATSDARTVIVLAATFSIVSILSTLIRLYIRVVRRQFDEGEGYILLGTFLSAAYSAVAVAQTRWGLGLNVEDVPQENVLVFSKIQYAGGPLYCATILFVKLSLTCFVRSLNAKSNRIPLLVLKVLPVFFVVTQSIFLGLLSFACQPIAKQWHPSIPGHCIDEVSTYYSLGGVSLFGDAVLMILPIIIVWGIKLHRVTKIRVIVIFSLGFAVTVVQIFRIVSVAKLVIYTESISSIEWSIVETNLGVFIACLPALNSVLFSMSESLRKRTLRKRVSEESSAEDLNVPLKTIPHWKRSKGLRRQDEDMS